MADDRTPGRRGRRPARHVPELHIGRFRLSHEAVGAAPATADVSAGITDWGMVGNDHYSNCGDAAWVHYLMAKAGTNTATLAGTTYQADDPALTQAALQPYFGYGRSQGEPGEEPDQGVENATWLKYLFDQGLIDGFAEVDLTNPDEAKWALINFKGMILGAALTDQAETEFANGQPWQVTSTEPIDPNEGHDFLWVSYDDAAAQGKVVTWARLQPVALSFERAEVQAHDMEGWVILTKEDAERAGVDLAALRQTLQSLDGTLRPAPAPSPAPAPAPASAPTPVASDGPEPLPVRPSIPLAEPGSLHAEVIQRLQSALEQFLVEAHKAVADVLRGVERR